MTSTETVGIIRDGELRTSTSIFTQLLSSGRSMKDVQLFKGEHVGLFTGFQARSKDQEILEEGGAAGPSLLPRRDHE